MKTQKSDREKAIEWYDSLPISTCMEVRKAFGVDISRKSITDKEIWRKETQPKVDFYRLNITINHLLQNDEILKYYAQSELFNLGLFFELLSKSSTFAHKAHKELNRLNK